VVLSLSFLTTTSKLNWIAPGLFAPYVHSSFPVSPGFVMVWFFS
jgi:hypothetical protein